ncbi:MAG: YitT family protein [Clostridia bacterium]|nr:YitT family protein [Clostridia bacterium]
MKRVITDFFYLVLGCAIMAIGTSCFLLPNQLSSGGFSGIATIIYYLFKFPMGTTILLLNLPFFLWAFFKLGKELIIKSLLGTVFLATFIDVFDRIPLLTSDKFLACIYGGVCIGIGMALVLKSGGSTGGTDLITYIAKSYRPYIRTSSLIVIIDIVIILLNVIFFKKVEIGLYSAIAIYLVGKMIDIVFEGVNFTKMMFIVSSKYREIAEEIGNKLERGSTGIYAKGMYTREKRMMLLCVASRREIAKIKQLATRN